MTAQPRCRPTTMLRSASYRASSASSPCSATRLSIPTGNSSLRWLCEAWQTRPDRVWATERRERRQPPAGPVDAWPCPHMHCEDFRTARARKDEAVHPRTNRTTGPARGCLHAAALSRPGAAEACVAAAPGVHAVEKEPCPRRCCVRSPFRSPTRVRRTPRISCEAVPASNLAGAGMRRHLHPRNGAAESFGSFIRLFDGIIHSLTWSSYPQHHAAS